MTPYVLMCNINLTNYIVHTLNRWSLSSLLPSSTQNTRWFYEHLCYIHISGKFGGLLLWFIWFCSCTSKTSSQSSNVKRAAQVETLGPWNLFLHEWAIEGTCGDWSIAHYQHYQNYNQPSEQATKQKRPHPKQANKQNGVCRSRFLVLHSFTLLSCSVIVAIVCRTAVKQPSWKQKVQSLNQAPWVVEFLPLSITRKYVSVLHQLPRLRCSVTVTQNGLRQF